LQQNKIQGLKQKIHEHTGTKRSIKPKDLSHFHRCLGVAFWIGSILISSPFWMRKITQFI
jgi:hypothetical protein